MNTAETLEKMSLMRLQGMKQAYSLHLETGHSSKMTDDELVALLIENEYTDRQNRKTDRLFKNARFRYNASIEEIEFKSERNLDKSLLLRLASGDYIKSNKNIIITGPTGAGKSYIASALGHQACIIGYKVLYYNTGKLFSRLKMLQADASDIREKLKIEKHDLLILDDFGLQALDTENRLTLLEIIEDRHERKSTIITSQLPVTGWHEVIGDPTIADAILDRIVHNSIRINIEGGSMRKKKNVQLQEKKKKD
ncbi:IS21-like element helper ATPase IstB [Bacteroidota bacterium]